MSSIFTSSSSLDKVQAVTVKSEVNISFTDSDAISVMEPDPLTWKPTKSVRLIFLVQYVVCFVVALDATILTSALPDLAKALDVSATKAFWIVSSYLLTSAVFQPAIASLSDVFGRRAIYFLVIILFTVGTTICCACNNVAGMLAGRSIQGIGGGGVLSLNLIILSDLAPLRQRAQYQGYLQLVFALGSNLAPIIGGVIVQHTTWRWLFLLNIPFCVVGLAAVPFVLRYERPTATWKSRMASIDWAGIASFVTSVTTFLVGLCWAGSQYSWSSAATLCPLLIGLAGVGATVAWELRVAKKPFLRLNFFDNRSAVATYTCTVLLAFLMYGCMYYLVFWLIVVKNHSNVMAGVAILPFGLTLVPTSGITGTIISKVGKYQQVIWCGWIICTLGMGLLTLLHVHTTTLAYVFIFVTCGIGQGLLMISLSAASQAIADTKDAAYASSMYAFMRSLGLCFGVSISGTIFQNFLSSRLQHLGLPTEIARNAEAYALLLKAAVSSPQKDAIVEAYAWAFRMLFTTLTGISGLGLVLGFIIGKYSLDSKLDPEHVLKQEDSNEA